MRNNDLKKQFYFSLDDTKNEKLLGEIGNALATNTSLEEITIEGKGLIKKEYDQDILLALVAGLANKKLKSLHLRFLKLQDTGISAIASILEKQNTLEKLTFYCCHITANSMSFLEKIFISNNCLTELNLAYNELNTDGIKKLAELLPGLPKLKKLSLQETFLEGKAFNYLVKEMRHLEELQIGQTFVDSDYLSALTQLILFNNHLKHLDIKNNETTEEHIEFLQELLSDPTKCYLREFYFGIAQPWNPDFEKILIHILNSNTFLTKLDSGTNITPELCAAMEKKRRHSQQFFINQTTCLSNIYYGKPKNKSSEKLSSLPVDVFLIILCQLGKDTLGMNEESILKCSKLILQNFKFRRQLINNKQYLPSSKTPSINQWWSQWTRHDDKPQQLFRNATIQEPRAVKKKKCNIM